MNKYFTVSNDLKVIANSQMDNKTVKKLWNSFCLQEGNLTVERTQDYIFCTENTQPPVLPSNKEYILKADEKGIAITGRDYGGLMRGFASLLMKFEYDNGIIKIQAVSEESNYMIQNRMLHICVFPENDLYYIKKLIRLAGLCQYTHIVMEFWGMLQYDCLKELAWPNAFTKEQAKELICECKELGIEPIPMFNQLGHATASRVRYGKHVVLDQNPRLQELFTPDGWAWNIDSEAVFLLLKQVRSELYELFGNGEYIHIGCDEAYYITRNRELRKKLPDFLAKLTYEVEAEGRRPMIWMDMLLEEGQFESCYAVGKKNEVSRLRNSTAKSTVFVDWQYDCMTSPIPSLLSLKASDHDIIGAPWCKIDNYKAHIDTVTQQHMFGLMLTTWHKLKENMASILGCAKECGSKSFVWSEFSGLREETATLLRRISFEDCVYGDCGWAEKQIEI